jgi:hypothetical protein
MVVRLLTFSDFENLSDFDTCLKKNLSIMKIPVFLERNDLFSLHFKRCLKLAKVYGEVTRNLV